MGPVSNFILNFVYQKIAQCRESNSTPNNFLVAFPYPKLQITPLIARIIADQLRLPVVTYCVGQYYWKDYHTLCDANGYIWQFTPAALYQKKKMKIKPYIQSKRLSRTTRQKFRDFDYSTNFRSRKGHMIYVPRQLFPLNLIQTETNALFSIVIENIERFIGHSQERWQELKETILDHPNSCFHFIHFSNPFNPLIKRLQEEEGCYILHFSKSLLTRNEWMKSKYKDYLKKYSSPNISSKMRTAWQRYNLDLPEIYKDPSSIVMDDPLPSGNIDFLLKELNESYHEFERYDSLTGLASLTQIPYIMCNLVISPQDYKHRIFDWEIEDYRYYTIPTIVGKYRELIQEKIRRKYSGPIINYLLDLSTLYYELCENKNYYIESTKIPSYNRRGKNYQIMRLLHEHAIKTKDQKTVDNLVVGMYSGIERNRIEDAFLEGERIESSKSKDYLAAINIYFKTFAQSMVLGRNLIQKSELILPGPIPLSFLDILLYPWKKIRFLNYEGINRKYCESRKKLASTISIEEEAISINFFKSLGKSQHIPLVEDFERRKKRIFGEKDSGRQEVTKKSQFSFLELKQRIGHIINKERKFNVLKDEWEIEEKVGIENEIIYSRIAKKTETIAVVLERISDYLPKTCYLREDKVYYGLRYNPQGKQTFFEGFPVEFKKGDLIIYLTEEERKNFIDFIEQNAAKFGTIDYETIDYWREVLAHFAKGFRIKKDLYRIYKREFSKISSKEPVTITTFYNWIRGKTTYPRNAKNLYILGMIMNDELIIDEFEHIVREGKKAQYLHIWLGKKLSKLIKMAGRSFVAEIIDLNDEDEQLLQQIEQKLYLIKSISGNN